MRLGKPLFIGHLVGLPSPERYLASPRASWHVEAGAAQRPLSSEKPTSCLSLLDRVLAGWPHGQVDAVFIGTARGELSTLLALHEGYIQGQAVNARALVQTSFGALASYVAQHLGIRGLALTVSQTCVSGLAALYMAALFLQSGGGGQALFGAVEAPLHPLVIQGFSQLRLYTKRKAWPYTNPFGSENTLALAEAVVLGLLSTQPSVFRLEAASLSVVASPTYTGFSEAALEAVLEGLGPLKPDGVILHAPGTRRGDLVEARQVQHRWGPLPMLSFKPFAGHSVGASGLQGLQLAAWLLQNQAWLVGDEGVRLAPPETPIPSWSSREGFVAKLERPMRRLAVLGAGFGGAAAGVVLAYEP